MEKAATRERTCCWPFQWQSPTISLVDFIAANFTDQMQNHHHDHNNNNKQQQQQQLCTFFSWVLSTEQMVYVWMSNCTDNGGMPCVCIYLFIYYCYYNYDFFASFLFYCKTILHIVNAQIQYVWYVSVDMRHTVIYI